MRRDLEQLCSPPQKRRNPIIQKIIETQLCFIEIHLRLDKMQVRVEKAVQVGKNAFSFMDLSLSP